MSCCSKFEMCCIDALAVPKHHCWQFLGTNEAIAEEHPLCLIFRVAPLCLKARLPIDAHFALLVEIMYFLWFVWPSWPSDAHMLVFHVSGRLAIASSHIIGQKASALVLATLLQCLAATAWPLLCLRIKLSCPQEWIELGTAEMNCSSRCWLGTRWDVTHADIRNSYKQQVCDFDHEHLWWNIPSAKPGGLSIPRMHSGLVTPSLASSTWLINCRACSLVAFWLLPAYKFSPSLWVNMSVGASGSVCAFSQLCIACDHHRRWETERIKAITWVHGVASVL